MSAARLAPASEAPTRLAPERSAAMRAPERSARSSFARCICAAKMLAVFRLAPQRAGSCWSLPERDPLANGVAPAWVPPSMSWYRSNDSGNPEMSIRSLGLTLVASIALHGAARAQDVAAGEKVFAKCKVCHQVGEGAKNGVGPVLNGIVGRKAGSVEGYSYTP